MNRTDDGPNRCGEWFRIRAGLLTAWLLVFGIVPAGADATADRGNERTALVRGPVPLIGAYYYPWYSGRRTALA